ncbi:hypothetical protein F5X96DRAFT_656249 [Biscogniauxia mediterranea]|nr:hypothetical protein F5X96DRAFT_656249 [Biscogniauxia mediterranea]
MRSEPNPGIINNDLVKNNVEPSTEKSYLQALQNWDDLTQANIYLCKKEHEEFAEFCFFCNKWFTEVGTWEEHCLLHLDKKQIPMELSWQAVGNTWLPGYCPFCLWDKDLPALQRMCQFLVGAWCGEHVCDNIMEITRGHNMSLPSSCCPDERCSEAFDDSDLFCNHTQDIHRVPNRLFFTEAYRGVKRKASAESLLDHEAKRACGWDVFDYQTAVAVA